MVYDNVSQNCGFFVVGSVACYILKMPKDMFVFFSLVGYFTTLLVPQNL